MNRSRALIVTFDTTAAAMAMEKACRAAGLPGRLMPVPRALTADCGICWRAEPAQREALERVIREHTLEPAGIHELEL